MLSRMALGGIWAYQQYISPNKGFRCACSVAHGGTGCSGFAKHAIRDHGLWGALPAIRQRFRDCRAAYEDIRANCSCNTSAPDGDDERPLSEDERKELLRLRKQELRKRDRRGRDRCCDTCECCGSGCGPSPFAGCFGGAARGGASKNVDLNPCDGDGCGLDCGAADCVSCDCGGCSCG
ncbi:hemolytic domain-containing protein [Litoreibacter ponti]|uniref:Hemolytic domain-containing protein n=1 Tax=Litoreibacter ponti TaxID=1510457 RepID=A0A2T6BM33_9RHOB|nr:membrane protein insertion efficiency factor YidD [Litoreibacter ponti]PTX57119.1 hemolytic domain-containing protein [Litoreibacter ponti]